MDSNFNKENKVSYQELAPSLQAMLDGKASVTVLNNHINDNGMLHYKMLIHGLRTM